MTAEQLYLTYQTLADQARQAYLTPPKFARLYWVCQIDWLKDWADKPNTEKSRTALRPFRRVHTGVGSTMNLLDIRPVVLYKRALLADFGPERTGMAVTPVDEEEFGLRQQNPYQKGTDDDPIYTELENASLTVHATTVPTKLQLVYITYPVPLDPLKPKAEVNLLESEDNQIAIVRRVIAEKDLIDEKYNRYQLLAGGVIPAREQTT